MATNVKDTIKKLNPAQRKKVEALAALLIAEEMPLREPRKAHKPEMKSAVAIARALGTEGFSDYVAGLVTRYWRNNKGLTERQTKQLDRLAKDITEMTKDMTAGERLALGRFIGLHKKMAFDAGLRIGLTTQLFPQKDEESPLDRAARRYRERQTPDDSTGDDNNGNTREGTAPFVF